MTTELLIPCKGEPCAWCGLKDNPADMQIIEIHDKDNPDIIVDVALVCNCCLEKA